MLLTQCKTLSIVGTFLTIKTYFLVKGVLSTSMVDCAYLEPTFGHEEIVFDTPVSKLFCNVEAHRAILVIDLPLGVIIEDSVGVVDLLELLSSLWVIWILIRVISKCQFPERDRQLIF